jgi:cell division septation protein DedD
MTTASRERRFAIAASDGTCPRCGAARAVDQRYCLQCGDALPVVTGRLASMRRRWVARIGWYPGDWMWLALATLVVAAAGAVVAIAVSEHRQSSHRAFEAVGAPVSVREPARRVPTGKTPTTKRNTTNLPTAPEPGVLAPGSGRTVWPANEIGWTIVLVSYPKTFGHPQALQTATKAAKAGLTQVGVVDSSLYASLQPGYYVVFTGIYPSRADADAAVGTARQAGFPGAYSREIAR